jgi:hypothetical protein
MHKSKSQDNGVEIRNLAVIFGGAHWYDTIQWLTSGVRSSFPSSSNKCLNRESPGRIAWAETLPSQTHKPLIATVQNRLAI